MAVAVSTSSTVDAFSGPGAAGPYRIASSMCSSEEVVSKPPPLPATNDPYTLLGFASPPGDFCTVRHAYKELTKLYHPDVVAGPDASPEERKSAGWDFARINTAYDILESAKRRKEEEDELEEITYEVTTGGGTGFDHNPHRSSESRGNSRWDDDYDEGGIFFSKKRIRKGVSPDAPPEAQHFFKKNAIDFDRIKASNARRRTAARSWWDSDGGDFRSNTSGKSFGPSF